MSRLHFSDPAILNSFKIWQRLFRDNMREWWIPIFGRTKKQFAWEILDWIFPPSCCGCGIKGAVICPSCRKSLTLLRRTCLPKICGKPFDPLDRCKTCRSQEMRFTSARAAFLYQGIVREAIHQLKYSGNLEFTGICKLFIICILKAKLGTGFCNRRSVVKGKNERAPSLIESEWIAKPLAKAIRKPYLKGALRKKQDTDSQVGLGRTERIENLRGAFQAEPILVRGKNILVIDDVMTTGSTFNECAGTCKKHPVRKTFFA